MQPTDPLFSLVPLTPDAEQIVRLEKNRRYRVLDKTSGKTSLSFEAGHESCFPTRYLSIGCLDAGVNDVLLPTDGTYAQQQCFFFISPSGELVLEDSTTGHHTYIDGYEAGSQKPSVKYSFRSWDPRRRAIPLDDTITFVIHFGKLVSFQFVWQLRLSRSGHVDYDQVDAVRACLSQSRIARVRPEKGMMLTAPRDPNLAETYYEKRTTNTPEVPEEFDGKPLREVYAYNQLGKGGFGTVFKCVDLATGLVWAVKECRDDFGKGDEAETWKIDFKNEVEKLATLRHPNIIRLEHHQGWSKNSPVSIFFPLCDGSLAQLFPARGRHACIQPAQPVLSKATMAQFIDQTLAGLDYIHSNGMVHMDLKPENILYTRSDPKQPYKYHFVIADLGVVKRDGTELGSQDPIGDFQYLAPEMTVNEQFTCATDMYSFGIILLEAMGGWCREEARPEFTEQRWRQKLQAYGASHWQNYRDQAAPADFPVKHPQELPRHCRIQSLIACGILTDEIGGLLDYRARLRPTAAEARSQLLAIYPLPSHQPGGHKRPEPRRKHTGTEKDYKRPEFRRETTGSRKEPKSPGLGRQPTGGWGHEPEIPGVKRRPTHRKEEPNIPGFGRQPTGGGRDYGSDIPGPSQRPTYQTGGPQTYPSAEDPKYYAAGGESTYHRPQGPKLRHKKAGLHREPSHSSSKKDPKSPRRPERDDRHYPPPSGARWGTRVRASISDFFTGSHSRSERKPPSRRNTTNRPPSSHGRHHGTHDRPPSRHHHRDRDRPPPSGVRWGKKVRASLSDFAFRRRSTDSPTRRWSWRRKSWR